MHTNLTVKEVPSFLKWKDESLHVQYVYDTTTADYELSQIYNRQIEEDLNHYGLVDLRSWKMAFTDEIAAMQQRVYMYRSTALLMLTIFILIPAIFLYFYQDNTWVLVGAVVYTLLAFFLVESYNQALLNKFQSHFKNHLQLEHLVAAKVIPFKESDLDSQVTPPVVHIAPNSTIPISRFEKGTVNEIRFTLTDNGVNPYAVVTETFYNTLHQ